MSVLFLKRGSGARNRIDHVIFSTSDAAWQAVSAAALVASESPGPPQHALWHALDTNLRGKGSGVKLAVQASCLRQLQFRSAALVEWVRASAVVARGAHALFQDGTDGQDDPTHAPFELVGGRSQVRPGARRDAWQAGVDAHHSMVASEQFETLTPAELGGLFMLTYTPDHCAMRTDAFCTDYWWLRVMHLSIGRSVKVQMRPFVLPRSMDAAAAAGAMGSARAALATRQLATAVALKVAIFYKKRGRDASPPRISHHDVDNAKRRCLHPQPQARLQPAARVGAPRAPRAPTPGVADCVRAAMRDEILKTRVPVCEVLQRAVRERMALNERIRLLDNAACTHTAWRRARADPAAAAAALATTGLPLSRADSVWCDVAQASVRKLVAVGAGSDWRPRVVHARTEAERRALFGASGTGGRFGSAAMARAARAELTSLLQRLVALLALEFRLREGSSATTHTALPLELHGGNLAVEDAAPSRKLPAHVEAYARALRARSGHSGHERTFSVAVARSVARAIRGAFFGCLGIVSSTGTAVVDAALDAPRARAALAVVNCVLSTAARCNGLIAHDCDDEGAVPIARYNRETARFTMPDLEAAVAHNWPEARALADVAAACEPWVRDARKAPPPPPPPPAAGDDGAWWVRIGPRGLAVDHSAKEATLARIGHAGAGGWWNTWPATRDEVLASEARVTTAIAWGGLAAAAFFGIRQPDQYVGRAPFRV